jgi:hypothetical protein
MGHSLGTDEHYISRDVETYRKLYADNYASLRIYEPPTPYLTEEQIRKIVEEYLKTPRGQELISRGILGFISRGFGKTEETEKNSST